MFLPTFINNWLSVNLTQLVLLKENAMENVLIQKLSFISPCVAIPLIPATFPRSTCMYSMLDSVELHQDPAVLYSLLLFGDPEDPVSCQALIWLFSNPRGDVQAEKETK